MHCTSVVTFLRRCGLKQMHFTIVLILKKVTFLRRCGLKHIRVRIFGDGQSHLLTKVWIETSKHLRRTVQSCVTFLRRCGLKHWCKLYERFGHLVTFLRRCGLKRFSSFIINFYSSHLLTKVWIETFFVVWLNSHHKVTFLRRCGLKLWMYAACCLHLSESPSYEGVDWNFSRDNLSSCRRDVTFLRRCGLKLVTSLPMISFTGRHLLTKVWIETFFQLLKRHTATGHLLTKVWIETGWG